MDANELNTEASQRTNRSKAHSVQRCLCHRVAGDCPECRVHHNPTDESLLAEIERLRAVIKAKDQLLAAYRTGDRTLADKALKALEKRGWSS